MRAGLATLLLSLAVSGACRDDSTLDESSRDYATIAGIIATAVDNYASGGPAALYRYMDPEVTLKCTAEQFEAAVGRRQDIGQLVRINEVTVHGDVATVELTLSTASGVMNVTWKMQRNVRGGWGPVLEVPGSEACTP